MLTRLTLFLAATLLLSVCAFSASQDSQRMTLFAAGYNGTIVPYSVSSDGKLAQLSTGVVPNSSGNSPSWIAYSVRSAQQGGQKSENLLYAVTDLYTVDESATGRVFSHTYDSKTFVIAQTGKTQAQRTEGTWSAGDGPVSCLVGHGPSKGLLFVANYNSGSAAVLAIDPEDGTLEEKAKYVFQFTRPSTAPKVGPVADRQDHSYAHQVSISPSGQWVYVCDLGADQIHHLHISPQGIVKFTNSTNVTAGSGPRHMTFHRDQHGRVFAYLASELDNTVSAFTMDEQSGKLTLIAQPILASPPGTPLSGPGILPTNRTTAEIAVVPAGDYVYVSNRGDCEQDHISIFKRNQESGQLSFVEWVASGGRMPRHFSLSSDTARDDQANWLVVGHQTDQNIVLFHRDPSTGRLTKADTKADVGQVAFTGFSPF